MTTRVKIDLSQGVLEVEGSETFVKAIYNDFKAHFIDLETPTEDLASSVKPRRARNAKKVEAAAESAVVEAAPAEAAEPAVTPAPEPLAVEPAVEPVVEPKAPPVIPTYTFIQNLNLTATEGHPSLVEFMDSKLPITNEERNLVFLFYLQHVLKLKPITIDHIFTCYRQAKIRVPLNLEQSLRHTTEQHGWIKLNQNGNMTLSPEGKLYVEKQLPNKKVKN